jgi:hypothetical protein
MRKVFFFFVLVFVSVLPVMAQQQIGVSPVNLKVNWQAYLSRHDMVWDTMPGDYFEAPFVGNGLLGTIVFKDNLQPNTLRFEIGRTDVYDHRSKDLPIAHYGGRIPIGQLLLSTAGEIKDINLRTDLWNAEIRGTIQTTLGQISFRCFVPTGDNVIVLNVKTSTKEQKAIFRFRPQQAVSSRYLAQPLRDKGFVYMPNPPFREETLDGIPVVTQPLTMGDDFATAWHERKQTDSTRTIMVTVANRWAKTRQLSSGSAIDAVATIKAAEKKSISTLERVHRDWWHAYYPKSFVTFPDTRMESFYWIQQYKLASATRSDKPVIDLMGPWYKATVWPCLWMNLNVQLSYYTTGITNHLDLEEPLYRLIEKHRDQLVLNVPEEFRDDCAALGNPVGYDELVNPVFLTTDRTTDREMNIIVLPWLMQQFYVHNKRTMDDERLRNSIFPLMKKTYSVYLRILYKGDDGLYHIPLTFSDEYGKAQETSMNIALARWGFKTLLDICTRLKLNDPLVPVWKEHLDKMADYHTNENGIMIGKGVPFAKPHRHYSHMLGIFPFYETNIEDNEASVPMLKNTVQHFTDVDGDNCMYKFSGASSIWSSLGNGDSALKWVNRSLDIFPRIGEIPKIPTCTPNTMYCERGNPTFESPISSSRSMLDMLIQSWGNTIRVFPATPSSWKDASFYQLRAEGAFLVSAHRENGKTQFIHVKSLAGEPCIIQSDLPADVKMIGIAPSRLQHKNGKIILDLKKGEEAVLYTGPKPQFFLIDALPMAKKDMNQWGLKGLDKL